LHAVTDRTSLRSGLSVDASCDAGSVASAEGDGDSPGAELTTPARAEKTSSTRVGTPTVGLQRRLSWVFLALVTAVLALSSLLFFLHARHAYIAHQQQQLRLHAQLTAAQIDGDLHARLRSTDEPGYRLIRDQLRRSRSGAPWVRDIYTMARRDDGTWYFVVDAEPPDSEIFSDFGTSYDASQDPLIAQALEGPNADDEIVHDEYGDWMSGHAPIHASDGRAVGIVGVDMSASEFRQEQLALAGIALLVFIVALALATIAGRYVLRRVADPIVVEQELEAATRRELEAERDRAIRVAAAVRAGLTREAQFRTLFDNAPDALVLFGPDGKVHNLNAPARLLWPGLDAGSPAPESLRAVIAEVIAPDSAPTARAAVQLTLEGAVGPIELEARFEPITLIEGPGALAALRDVTERRRAERALEGALAQSSRALVEREVLLQEVHHRVKNNLQIVSSLLEMQAADADPEVRDTFLDSVQRVRSMALVHQMLYGGEDLSRIDFGAYAATMVNQLRGALAADSEVEIDVDKVELTTERAVPCGLILNELVTNALKHGRSADGRCRLRVQVRALAAGFQLIVADQGPGLHADASSPRRSLGRDIIRGLVRQLRATLTSDSAGGTTFTLTVPHES
jgi:two-component sensor histidine kinase